MEIRLTMNAALPNQGFMIPSDFYLAAMNRNAGLTIAVPTAASFAST
jgi:hypothetical protein